ncbi:response regulator [Bradyrhizobium sp. 180]|uniref:response regulator transcription factor n=1 Tax=unclassified Bradyrhizobium TaxID=2631580 RepID=UPI001FFABFCA|nr:response regulator [Bradyrhizobium sp. CW12]MCK1489825.1 response regulator [Bradyrhizobium sp. 180]MCK1532391.1 response regulator [Bradyrhizobium sp. 182]MCK1595645.1 response regulator [Bradyrhizobium sp. 164]MCK1647311.1 response regulator [Bradyrhizobium sp. 154]MCK1669046.1 response regulator [Bradyrhizobium sp. 153]MCK1755299.1 response regulator [Bradyrhizobium sp. 137]
MSELSLAILVVEDEQLIWALVEDALVDGGYEAEVAATGEEAVTLLQGTNSKYRALVTDINLAGTVDGWEVARCARAIDPNFPVVYMSGASADKWPIHGVPNSLLLAKPFAPAQLVTAISNLLNATPIPPAE